MELLEGIETRRSLRAFTSTPVPEEIMGKILKAVSKSPSYTNTQPWEVAVVSGNKKEELARILSDLWKSEVAPNPDLPLPKTWPPELDSRVKEHSASRFKALGVERGDDQHMRELRLQNFKFFGAPCGLFLFMDSTLTPWSIFDMGVFAQSIQLAAHSFGIGSCLQAMLVNYPDAVREFLGIPKTKQLIIGISIGYPDYEARINAYQSTRMSVDDFVQWYS